MATSRVDEQLREPAVSGVENRDGAVLVHLAGELDLHNAPEVRQALDKVLARKPEQLIVDLAEVVFVDSAAVGVLIDARRRLQKRDGFLVAAPGVEIRRALEVSGLDRQFAVVDSVDAAFAAR